MSAPTEPTATTSNRPHSSGDVRAMPQRPSTATKQQYASPTKTILTGLIPFFEDVEDQADPKDFHPPIPESIANLLAQAEEKVNKIMRKNAALNKKEAGKSKDKSKDNLQKGKGKKIVKVKKSSAAGKKSSNHAAVSLSSHVGIANSVLMNNVTAEPMPPSVSSSAPPIQTDNLITVGGYMIKLEQTLLDTYVRPTISSVDAGLALEIFVTGVDPKKIVVERRYNSVLIIGVRGGTVANVTADTEITEVVNVFAPKDTPLDSVFVAPADDSGRVVIRLP